MDLILSGHGGCVITNVYLMGLVFVLNKCKFTMRCSNFGISAGRAGRVCQYMRMIGIRRQFGSCSLSEFQ